MTVTPPFIPEGLAPQSNVYLLDTALSIHDKWCVYEHWYYVPDHETPTLIYVNACPLHDVFNMADARHNSDWQSLMKPSTYIGVKIIYTGAKAAATKEALRYVRTFNPMPRCNLYGYDTRNSARAIMCSNGKEYATQQEAATDLGLNQGQLSRHLNGQLKHVKGFKFAYKNHDANAHRYAPPVTGGEP